MLRSRPSFAAHRRPQPLCDPCHPPCRQVRFDGKVTIALKVVKPARELVLNAADLTFGTGTLTPLAGQPLTAKVTTDEAAQTVTFAFDQRTPRAIIV